eukprot:scaffold74063_cov61-Attheya_sp.AAC.2
MTDSGFHPTVCSLAAQSSCIGRNGTYVVYRPRDRISRRTPLRPFSMLFRLPSSADEHLCCNQQFTTTRHHINNPFHYRFEIDYNSYSQYVHCVVWMLPTVLEWTILLNIDDRDTIVPTNKKRAKINANDSPRTNQNS